MYDCRATVSQRAWVAEVDLALAHRVRDAYVKSGATGGRRAVPSLAATSAASLPGTQQTRTAPGWVYGRTALAPASTTFVRLAEAVHAV
jgi:hypothetical protein